MLKNKLLVMSLVICISSGLSMANANLTLPDLVTPKGPAYRVGISEIPENQYVEAQQTNSGQEEISSLTNDMSDGNNTDVSYAELSLKRLSREISQDLTFEQKDMVSDLTLLWQGAAMQSDTINFALYKLANPDADKPNKSTVKNMLKTIASMSTLAGASMANPLLAGTSLIGGNVLNIMSQDTKALNYKYTKVSDADMIILIRKIEDLQQNAVNLYYDYMTAKKQLELTTNVVNERKNKFETAQKNNAAREIIVVTDAYYRTALDRQKTARSEFLSKRAALEQFVGNEAFTQFENELYERENTPKTNKEQDIAYIQTIQGVENYTNNLTAETGSKPTYQVTNGEFDSNIDKIPDIAPLTSDDTILAKEDKYSTKGLIFVHNSNTQTTQEQPAVQEQQQTSSKKKKVKKNKKEKSVDKDIPTKTPEQTPASVPESKKINGVELLPLDELKAPNFYHNGTIFSE